MWNCCPTGLSQLCTPSSCFSFLFFSFLFMQFLPVLYLHDCVQLATSSSVCWLLLLFCPFVPLLCNALYLLFPLYLRLLMSLVWLLLPSLDNACACHIALLCLLPTHSWPLFLSLDIGYSDGPSHHSNNNRMYSSCLSMCKTCSVGSTGQTAVMVPQWFVITLFWTSMLLFVIMLVLAEDIRYQISDI